MRHLSRRSLAPAAAVALLLGFAVFPGSAAAQSPETPSARADRLFREGKAALEASHFAEACPKLAESQRLDPGTGTLLALALCHEGNGQTATAWREFKEVVTASQKGRADRATLASQHIHTIEPLLSTVTLSVPDELRTVVRIRMDGEEVPVSTWSAPIPVDPGDHVIEASAPGAPPWKTSVRVGANADSRPVTIPRLDHPAKEGPAPSVVVPPAVVPPVDTTPSTPMESRHKIGWTMVGIGGLSFVIGAVFGGLSLTNASTAKNLCPGTCTNANAVSDNNTAKTDAWVSDVGIGLGLAAGGVATYLLLTHDASTQPPSSSARLVPMVGPGLGGMSVAGAW